MKISATIIVKNEERNIGPCLDSLGFADEIVVVDSGSVDRTAEICRSHSKVRYFEHPWLGFGRQKNLATELAANDWVFSIDADERVSERLAASILAADFAAFCGFRVARENYFGDRWIRYCGWYPDHTLRLFDRTRGAFSEREVHEAVVCHGPMGTLDGNLVHRTYEGVSDYLLRMDRYSTLAAEQMLKEGRIPGAGTPVFRPVFTFFKMYLLKQGFREGYHGFLLSALYACYTFSKYAKAVELAESGRRGSQGP